MTDPDLKGRRLGVGHAISRDLMGRGADVIVADLPGEHLDTAVADIGH